MCSCSTKGRASLVIIAEEEGEAEEEGARVAEAEVTGKHSFHNIIIDSFIY